MVNTKVGMLTPEVSIVAPLYTTAFALIVIVICTLLIVYLRKSDKKKGSGTPTSTTTPPASRWSRFKAFLGRAPSASWAWLKNGFWKKILLWTLALSLIALVTLGAIFWSDLQSLLQEHFIKSIRFLDDHLNDLFSWIVWIAVAVALLPHLFTKSHRNLKLILGLPAIAIAVFFLLGPSVKMAEAKDFFDGDNLVTGLYGLVIVFLLIFMFKTVILGFSTWMAGTNKGYWYKVALLVFGLFVLVVNIFKPEMLEVTGKNLNYTVYRKGLEFRAWVECKTGSDYRQFSLAELNDLRRKRDEPTENCAGLKSFRGQMRMGETFLRNCTGEDAETCWGRYTPVFLKADARFPWLSPASIGIICRTVKGGPILMKQSGSNTETLIPPDKMMVEIEGDRWYRAQNPKDQDKIFIVNSQSTSQECSEPAPRPLPR